MCWFRGVARTLLFTAVFAVAPGIGTQPALACPDWMRAGERITYTSDGLWTPRTHRLTAGGPVNLSNCEMPGIGLVAIAPDFTLDFSANVTRRDLLIRVEAECDTVLLINDPETEWHFDDDSDGMNPAVRFEAADDGIYDIWIGTYEAPTCPARMILETFDNAAATQTPASSASTTSGTGFLVNRGGWILTSAHVVDGCAAVEVVGHGVVSTVIHDGAEDLAALRAGRAIDVEPLTFRTRRARLAEPAHAIGFPLSDILSPSVRVTSGSVNALSGLGQRENLIQISAPVQPGNSGGPVIDRDGSVIGVTTATLSQTAYEGAQNVNFAVPTSEALRFLEQNGIPHTLVDGAEATAQANDLSDLVEAAAAATFLILCLDERPD
jgi:S1-C subfamily serine protease